MAATATTQANLIPPYLDGGYSVLKFINDGFLRAMVQLGMTDVRQIGGTSHQFNILRSGNTSGSATYTEGDPSPAAGNQVWLRGLLGFVNYIITVSQTKTARDALGTRYSGVSDDGDEATEAERDLTNLVNVTSLGSGASGLLAAAGTAGNTYANINRAAITEWDPNVTAVGGALTLAVMETMAEVLGDAPRGGELGAILASPRQCTKYRQLAGASAVNANERLVRIIAGENGVMKYDPSPANTGLAFQGVPVVRIPDLSNSVMVFLCNLATDWSFVTIRPVEVDADALARGGDIAKALEITTRSTLKCNQTRRQGALTTLAT